MLPAEQGVRQSLLDCGEPANSDGVTICQDALWPTLWTVTARSWARAAAVTLDYRLTTYDDGLAAGLLLGERLHQMRRRERC